jgi:uncharacterized protein (TIGR01777 family)
MKVLLTGATGFVGRALVLRLRRDGHDVSAWVRSPVAARARLGGEVALVDAGSGTEALSAAVAASDAVVNLAGEAILPRRWSKQRKRDLVESRVGVTDRIARALARAPVRPRVFVSASAVGFYGDRGDEVLTEAAPPGTGFLADLCRDWEAAAERAAAHGVRVVTLRTGVVLGLDGGIFDRLAPLYRAGLGGRLGDGRQFLPWIHLHDLVELVATALADARYSGPINATAPEPERQRDFSRALALALGAREGPAVPRLVLHAALGEAKSALVDGQRVHPARARELGFRWAAPELAPALADLEGLEDVTLEALRPGPLGVSEPTSYVERRPPRHLLRAVARLGAPQDEVFAFFSRPENLGAMTPSRMGFRILGDVGPMQAGTRIDYRIRLGFFPLRWRTTIERFRATTLFVDSQERGPYRSWWHEHHFRSDGDHTVMEDRVHYALPFGWLGGLVHRLFVARTLRSIFRFRAHAVRLRFGHAGAKPWDARGAA